MANVAPALAEPAVEEVDAASDPFATAAAFDAWYEAALPPVVRPRRV